MSVLSKIKLLDKLKGSLCSTIANYMQCFSSCLVHVTLYLGGRSIAVYKKPHSLSNRTEHSVEPLLHSLPTQPGLAHA